MLVEDKNQKEAALGHCKFAGDRGDDKARAMFSKINGELNPDEELFSSYSDIYMTYRRLKDYCDGYEGAAFYEFPI